MTAVMMMMMDEPGRINVLADELLSLILEFLTAGSGHSEGRDSIPDYTFPPCSNHKRNGTIAASLWGENSDLDRFRLICRRFMRIATPWKFRRFTLRFSPEGFRRLDELVDMRLAHHTRYFTYMVRPYYRGGDWEQFLAELARACPKLADIHTARLADERSIVRNARDISSLKRALFSCSSLQQIKLLRLQDKADEDVMERARSYGTAARLQLKWEPACSRAIEGLGLALLGSSCQSIHFLGPQLSPEAALKLMDAPRMMMSTLGERLSCLDIYFHSTSDMTNLMRRLSSTFRDFFQATRNLSTINVRFPADSPLDLPLEDVFHHIYWSRLRSLGIQGWRLHSSEIIAIVRRHQSQLRELRLPHVYLLDGSRWRDVLSILHYEMDQLEKINLQHINYASHFNTQIMTGIEIPPGSTTDEDERREDEDEDEELHSGEDASRHSNTGSFSSIDSIHDSQSESSSESEESFRHQQHQYSYFRHNPNHHLLRDLQSLSAQELSMLSVNELGDNGAYVKREHWHIWERWIVGPRHRL